MKQHRGKRTKLLLWGGREGLLGHMTFSDSGKMSVGSSGRWGEGREGREEGGKVKQKQQSMQNHGSMKEYGTQDAAKRLLWLESQVL